MHFGRLPVGCRPHEGGLVLQLLYTVYTVCESGGGQQITDGQSPATGGHQDEAPSPGGQHLQSKERL